MTRWAYLDHAAGTPVRPEARDAILPWLGDRHGNPSGSHRWGRGARAALDDAREQVAEALAFPPEGVVWTSGGTEADNLAVAGARRRGDGGTPMPPADGGTVVCPAAEHHAVLEAVEALGGSVVGVDRAGRVDLDALTETLTAAAEAGRSVRLVSVMAANNETGVANDLDAVAEVVRTHAPGALVHSDVVQAVAWWDPARWAAADLVSISAHKFGGPAGVGVLAARRHVEVQPILRGGGQERGRRSGTPNLIGAVGTAAALAATVADRPGPLARLGVWRDRIEAETVERCPSVAATLPEAGVSRQDRVPGIAHLLVDRVESEALLLLLEEEGVLASAGSSCQSGALDPSHVLAAMGITGARAAGALRLSLGWSSTEAEVEQLLAALPPAVARLRALDPR